MRIALLVRRVSMPLMALLLGGLGAVGIWMVAPALAQTASARSGGSVVAVVQLAEGANQSVFKIVISPQVSSFTPHSDDPMRLTLDIPRVGRSADLPAHQEFRGLVRSIDFEPSQNGIVVRFTPGAPAKISAKPSGNDGILVTVDRLTGPATAGPRKDQSSDAQERANGPLPQASQPLPGEDGYELVFLKYADVSEVVGLLSDGVTIKSNNVFIRREPGFGSLGAGAQANYPQPQQSPPEERPLGQGVDSNMAVDRRLNAIWIKGSPEHIARVKSQIALIDVPVDSVILETQFVELTEQGVKAIGIDFTNANGQIAVGTLQYGQYVPFGLEPKQVQPSFNLQAAIYAQVQKGEGRIVSRPRIAAQSGSTAKIITGDALPIVTAITLSGVNGVSQQVQYVNVGVTLQIAPRVSPDGFVTSHIYAVVSSVTGYSQGYPIISQREAETSATVRDGETFVIGGLTQENTLSSKTKVPLLGDIPLIGQAFRNERTTRSRTELYIIITPRIVRHRRFEDSQTVPPQDQADSPVPTPTNN